MAQGSVTGYPPRMEPDLGKAARHAYFLDGTAQEIYRVLEEAGAQAVRRTLTEAKEREMLNTILQIATGQGIESPSTQEWMNGWLGEKKERGVGAFPRQTTAIW